MFSEMLYLPIRVVLALANTVAFIWTCLYGTIIEVWQCVSSIFKLASATKSAVSSTYEASLWRSLWDDLFSHVFRALRAILNGFAAFFIACNRHRLSIYNYIEAVIQKFFCWTLQRSNFLDQDHGHHSLNTQPRNPSGLRRRRRRRSHLIGKQE
ncbi:hypothetical protein SAY86_018670 [Trapa natans]|uniref:Uncharacterized protein n=1 Tax=Trapa natans TaxID=22666 RepID=A0AAN7LD44_TRANT|nr:hypothetical protein SAY86_018670 [Trapa natans]